MSTPNVVVFLTDDHAAGAMRCAGNRFIHSPSLDYLASRGVTFENAFTPSPVCSPARASFWTGLYPSQHGIHDYLASADPAVAAVPWLQGEELLSDVLHRAGYQTAMVGKWHIGSKHGESNGFDYWYSQEMPSSECDLAELTSEFPCDVTAGGDRYNRHGITDHAVGFLRTRDARLPFFLFVGYFATHSPWLGHPERLVRSYRQSVMPDGERRGLYRYGRVAGEALQPSRADPREALCQYYAAVSEVDEQVGRVIDELEAQGLIGSTLVVYTSDHGLLTGQHGLWGKGNCTVPNNFLDESIRIPMIVSHPGEFLEGVVRSEYVTHCDLFETILDHTGVSLDDSGRARHAYPGRSFRALCRGEAAPDWPAAVFAEYGEARMIRTRSHKLVCEGDGRMLLFDAPTDDGEIVAESSAVERRKLAASLKTQIDTFFERYDEPASSGTRVKELPRHNLTEAWRDNGPGDLVVYPTYIPGWRKMYGLPDGGA